MGWMCSWVAVQGVAKGEILAVLDLVETGEQVEPGSRRRGLSCLERPNGWTVVFSEDFEWADRKRVLALSQLGLVVGCQFEDKVEMASIASAAKDGVELWRVAHVNDPIYRLDVSGEPPAELAGIREKFFREQDEDGGDKSSVDYISDIPLEVAKAACGYRADDEEALFSVLEPAGKATTTASSAGAIAGTPVRRGLLGGLLGLFGDRR